MHFFLDFFEFDDDRLSGTLVEHAPPKLVVAWSDSRSTHVDDGAPTACLASCAAVMGARKRFTRGAGIETPPAQHSLQNQSTLQASRDGCRRPLVIMRKE